MKINTAIKELLALQEIGETDLCVVWWDRQCIEDHLDDDVPKDKWDKTCNEFDDSVDAENVHQLVVDILGEN
jgi:hypothetical protein